MPVTVATPACPDVGSALHDIRFTGWATAEVGGGDKARLQEVLTNMRRVFDLA